MGKRSLSPSSATNVGVDSSNGTQRQRKKANRTVKPSEQNLGTETIPKKREESVNRATVKIEDGPDGYKLGTPSFLIGRIPSIIIDLPSWTKTSPRNRIFLRF